MSEAGQVVEAEKGKNLSPMNLHIRLRVVESITLVSLVLNLALWFFAGNINSKVEAPAGGRQEVQAQR
jgi:hypothetical protein